MIMNYRTKIEFLREAILVDIVDLILRHNDGIIIIPNEMLNDAPIIEDGANDDEKKRLNKIIAVSSNGFEAFASNKYDEGVITQSNIISTDLLLELYEWLVENEVKIK